MRHPLAGEAEQRAEEDAEGDLEERAAGEMEQSEGDGRDGDGGCGRQTGLFEGGKERAADHELLGKADAKEIDGGLRQHVLHRGIALGGHLKAAERGEQHENNRQSEPQCDADQRLPDGAIA